MFFLSLGERRKGQNTTQHSKAPEIRATDIGELLVEFPGTIKLPRTPESAGLKSLGEIETV